MWIPPPKEPTRLQQIGRPDSGHYSGPILGPRLQLPAKVAGHDAEHEAARDNCAMFMSATLGWGTPLPRHPIDPAQWLVMVQAMERVLYCQARPYCSTTMTSRTFLIQTKIVVAASIEEVSIHCFIIYVNVIEETSHFVLDR